MGFGLLIETLRRLVPRKTFRNGGKRGKVGWELEKNVYRKRGGGAPPPKKCFLRFLSEKPKI